MGDGINTPFTSEDVRRLIKENGGMAKGLDLSWKRFEEGIDLTGLDLSGIILKDAYFAVTFSGDKPIGARLNGSDLIGADFRNANLQYAQFKILNKKPTNLMGADFRGSLLLEACLQGANLTSAQFGIPEHVTATEDFSAGIAILENTDFRGANLFRSNFEGCYFYGTKLEGAFLRGADIFDAHLEGAAWGSYIIGEEKGKHFDDAKYLYTRLKTWYTNIGWHDVAAKFYYRGRESSRKDLKRWNDRAAGWFVWAYFGYGEGWKRILIWVAGLWLVSGLIYFLIGDLTPNSIADCLYYSAVSLTAVGYGSWVEKAVGWVKWLGVCETLLGNLMLASLLVTFVRKWTR